MKLPIPPHIITERGAYPVVGLHYSKYTCDLEMVESCTTYGPDRSFLSMLWLVDHIQDLEEGIKLTHVNNQRYHATLFF